MPLPVLPDYVMVELDSYSEKADYGVKRTDTDGGLPKQRPTRSLPITTRSCTLLIDGAMAKAKFDGWVRYDLAGGSGWFTLDMFPYPATLVLDFASGFYGQDLPLQARFTGSPPEMKPRGRDKWSCSTTIETIG